MVEDELKMSFRCPKTRQEVQPNISAVRDLEISAYLSAFVSGFGLAIHQISLL